MSLLISIFDPNDKQVKEDVVGTELTKKADCLFNMLRWRLNSYHVPMRVPRAKHHHWSLKWAKKNLAIVAAYMVVFKHTKKDVSFIGEKLGILTQPNGNIFLSCTNDEADLFGAYLSYDSGKEIWVRAGKATAAGKGSNPGGFKGCWNE